MIEEVIEVMIKLGVQNIVSAGIFAEELPNGQFKITITPGGTRTVIKRVEHDTGGNEE